MTTATNPATATIAKPTLTPRSYVTVADMYAWMYHGGKGYFSHHGSEVVDCSKNDDGTYLVYIRHDPFDKANKHLTTLPIYYPDVMFWCGSLVEPPATDEPPTPAPTPPSADLTLPPITLLADVAAELATAAQEAGDTANMHALNKAMKQLHEGTTPVPTTGGFLIESRTRGGTVHRLSTVHGCSCEAGRKGRACWHASLIEIVEVAQQRAARAIPIVPIPVGVKIARYRRAVAEVDELYA